MDRLACLMICSMLAALWGCARGDDRPRFGELGDAGPAPGDGGTGFDAGPWTRDAGDVVDAGTGPGSYFAACAYEWPAGTGGCATEDLVAGVEAHTGLSVSSFHGCYASSGFTLGD